MFSFIVIKITTCERTLAVTKYQVAYSALMEHTHTHTTTKTSTNGTKLCQISPTQPSPPIRWHPQSKQAPLSRLRNVWGRFHGAFFKLQPERGAHGQYTHIRALRCLNPYILSSNTQTYRYSCFLAIFVGRFVFQSCTSSVPPATFNQLDAFAAVRRPSDTVGAEWAPPYTSRVHHSFNVACALLHPFPLNANRKHQLDTCTQ